MAPRHRPDHAQLDLFVPYLTDLPLRDQRETMERPFFSLAKRKRLKPIDYVSPDGMVWVTESGEITIYTVRRNQLAADHPAFTFPIGKDKRRLSAIPR